MQRDLKTRHTGIKLLWIVMLFIPSWCAAQSNHTGSIEYLKACNGLDKITLGADVKDLGVNKLVFMDGDSKPDADSCYSFEYHDTGTIILGDSIAIDMIGLRTYHDKIVNIYVFFKKADAYKILKGFLWAYGPFTSRPDDYKDVYNWDSGLIGLSLRYQLDTDLGIAIYTSKTLQNEIAVKKVKASRTYAMQSLSASK